DAGRRLFSWVLDAGFDVSGTVPSASSWCYATPTDREWWGQLWAERCVESNFARQAVESNLADDVALEQAAQRRLPWTNRPDVWFAIQHGAVLARAGGPPHAHARPRRAPRRGRASSPGEIGSTGDGERLVLQEARLQVDLDVARVRDHVRDREGQRLARLDLRARHHVDAVVVHGHGLRPARGDDRVHQDRVEDLVRVVLERDLEDGRGALALGADGVLTGRELLRGGHGDGQTVGVGVRLVEADDTTGVGGLSRRDGVDVLGV